MKKRKTNTVWSGDFTKITAATVLSLIGGEVMNLPVSLLVYDQTKSPLLSALIYVSGILPDVLLPVLLAPLVDRGKKKPWIVGMDGLMAIVYIAMGVWVQHNSFVYIGYVLFALVIASISSLYRLAYNAWYPNLIPEGMEQKGYAVSGSLYPTITIIMSPVATFLYAHLPMHVLFYAVAVQTVLSIMIERTIEKDVAHATEESYSLRQYGQDLFEGFHYLKKEKGVRNIYSYMAITNGASEGGSTIVQAWYQSVPWLSVTMLGFLKSAEMIGRVLGGAFCYRKEIPREKRFGFTKFVYSIYDILDMVLLFLPYPLMLGSRFLCGALGTTSATIRSAAVQGYLPSHMRARVNAFFDMVVAVGGVFFQLLAGTLALVLPYRAVTALLGGIAFLCMLVLIALPGRENRPVYEA